MLSIQPQKRKNSSNQQTLKTKVFYNLYLLFFSFPILVVFNDLMVGGRRFF